MSLTLLIIIKLLKIFPIVTRSQCLHFSRSWFHKNYFNMRETIKTHKDLRVYQAAFDAALKIFEVSKDFPREEKYSLTDQIRRSSRSVCANLAEAFRKRRYEKAFIAKLSDCEGEAAETQVWLDFTLAHNYIKLELHTELYKQYENIIGQLVNMLRSPEKWSL